MATLSVEHFFIGSFWVSSRSSVISAFGVRKEAQHKSVSQASNSGQVALVSLGVTHPRHDTCRQADDGLVLCRV